MDRIYRYAITAGLVYITAKSYFSGIKYFFENDYLKCIQEFIPITLVNIFLILAYKKGVSIYGSSNQQRNRWFLIAGLKIFVFISITFAYIQKLEADKQTELSEIYRIKAYKTEFKLDSCMKK